MHYYLTDQGAYVSTDHPVRDSGWKKLTHDEYVVGRPDHSHQDPAVVAAVNAYIDEAKVAHISQLTAGGFSMDQIKALFPSYA